MAYRIGQYTNNSVPGTSRGASLIDNSSANIGRSIYFKTDVEHTQYDIESSSNRYLKVFRQLGFSRDAQDTSFSSSSFYSLTVKIKRIPANNYNTVGKVHTQEELNSLNINIYLSSEMGTRDSGIEQDSLQKIGSLYLPYSEKKDQYGEPVDEYVQYNLTFKPNKADCKYIVFRINRTDVDIELQEKVDNHQSVREWLLLKNVTGNNTPLTLDNLRNIQITTTTVGGNDIYNYYQLNNIMNNQVFQKIGYQGRPGSFIVINGTVIRVGKSGIFQLDQNQIDITSIMIPPTDNFLLDYAYDESGVS